MSAFVICLNDSIKHVVIGKNSTATNKMKELRKEYEKAYNVFNDPMLYWHIKVVPCTIDPDN